MKLDDKQINEIAQQLDVGMTCYIHKQTGELHALPNRLELEMYGEPELWEAEFQAVEQSPDDYIQIEKPSSRESFEFMESFVDKVGDSRIQNKLIEALNKRKPFRNFRNVVDYYEPVRQAWFKHKMAEYEAYVRRTLRYELEEETEPLEDIDLGGRSFELVQNSKNGLVDDETVFYYKQEGDLVTAEYFGGKVKYGKIIAKKDGNELDMRYQCLTTAGELKAGRALAQIVLDEEERIVLQLHWQWLDDSKQKGYSEYRERE